MPFVIVHGIPEGANPSVLIALRRDMVASLAQNMGVPTEWVRPFFVPDMLPPPTETEDGCATIYVRLDTGMFAGKLDDDVSPIKAVENLARLIWVAFGGKYEVEVFVGDLHPKWKKLLAALG